MDNEQIVTTSEVTSGGADEKFVPQTEVNRIAGRVRAETAEKTRREVEAEYAAKVAQNSGNGSVDPERIYEEVSRRVKQDFEKEQQNIQQAQQAQAWNAITREYNAKLDKTMRSKEYEDFHEVVGEFEHSSYDMVVYGANKQENTADIIYELAKDPERAIRLEMLGRNDPKGFEKAMDKFSKSVKSNKEAGKKAQSHSAPLSRVKSDVVTTGASTNADDYLSLKRRYYGG